MILLRLYCERDREQFLVWIADFYNFHAELVDKYAPMESADWNEVSDTLTHWCAEGHELYCIQLGEQKVGFLHIAYRGDIAAWIEDLYVDPVYRNQGIATQSIQQAEQLIRLKPGYQAVCFDVAPRNEVALRLYYKLGYNNLSLITIRKELGDNPRNKKETFLGYEFNI